MTDVALEAPDIFEEYCARNAVLQPFDTISYLPFQLFAWHKAFRFKRHILWVDKGLGKTAIALGVTKAHNSYPLIVVTTKKGMRTYLKETAKWFPKDNPFVCLIHGEGAKARSLRLQQWGMHGPDGPNPKKIFVVTMSSLVVDMGLHKGKHTNKTQTLPDWVVTTTKGWILDEFHRYIRSRKSTAFELLQYLTKQPNVEVLIPMSGSAIDKGPQDIWPALHLLDPKWWSSYWRYVGQFCHLADGFGGAKMIIGPKNVEAWRKAIQPYVTYIPKGAVKKHLKDKFRYALNYEIPDWQRKIHDDLLQELLTELPNGDYVIALNHLSAMYKARLALICPKALDSSLGYGGAIEDIVDEMEETNIKRWVLYTPFRKPIPLLADYLATRGIPSWTLMGGVSIDEQDRRIREWSQSENGVFICSTTYAESFELAPFADYCVFLDHLYSREENAQAEDRLHRLTSENPIFCLYAQCEGTVTERLWEIVMLKGYNVSLLFDTAEKVRSLIQGGIPQSFLGNMEQAALMEIDPNIGSHAIDTSYPEDLDRPIAPNITMVPPKDSS